MFKKMRNGETFQLICLPYLGGNADFCLQMCEAFLEDIEILAVNPPGHGRSSSQPVRIQILVDMYFQALVSKIKHNCIVFGHSMGGVIAYYLTKKIIESEKFSIKPTALVLSACGVTDEVKAKKLSAAPKNVLFDYLVTCEGIPKQCQMESDFFEYFMPIYTADFMVLESAPDYDNQLLDIPIYYLWGENDKIVPIESVMNWKKYFSRNINLIPIANGTHMFICDQPELVANELTDIILFHH